MGIGEDLIREEWKGRLKGDAERIQAYYEEEMEAITERAETAKTNAVLLAEKKSALKI